MPHHCVERWSQCPLPHPTPSPSRPTQVLVFVEGDIQNFGFNHTFKLSGLGTSEASVLVRGPGRGLQQTANCHQVPQAGTQAGKQDIVQDKPEPG